VKASYVKTEVAPRVEREPSAVRLTALLAVPDRAGPVPFAVLFSPTARWASVLSIAQAEHAGGGTPGMPATPPEALKRGESTRQPAGLGRDLVPLCAAKSLHGHRRRLTFGAQTCIVGKRQLTVARCQLPVVADQLSVTSYQLPVDS
jgi:hypothetical protein